MALEWRSLGSVLASPKNWLPFFPPDDLSSCRIRFKRISGNPTWSYVRIRRVWWDGNEAVLGVPELSLKIYFSKEEKILVFPPPPSDLGGLTPAQFEVKKYDNYSRLWRGIQPSEYLVELEGLFNAN